jgi:hypothetical protein
MARLKQLFCGHKPLPPARVHRPFRQDFPHCHESTSAALDGLPPLMSHCPPHCKKRVRLLPVLHGSTGGTAVVGLGGGGRIMIILNRKLLVEWGKPPAAAASQLSALRTGQRPQRGVRPPLPSPPRHQLAISDELTTVCGALASKTCPFNDPSLLHP